MLRTVGEVPEPAVVGAFTRMSEKAKEYGLTLAPGADAHSEPSGERKLVWHLKVYPANQLIFEAPTLICICSFLDGMEYQLEKGKS